MLINKNKMQATLKRRNLPVFVFPVSLEFYIAARHTYKQLLTLYNPYDFPVAFKVLSTAPQHFAVLDAEAIISPQSCIDIVVRYTKPSLTHANTTEKFRITMHEKGSDEELGKRDVLAQMIRGQPPSYLTEGMLDKFLPLTNNKDQKDEEVLLPEPPPPPSRLREQQPVNVVAVAVSICCIAVLLLPTQPEPVVDSQWPEWLRIGSNLKLVFAFVLGLVSMLVLRP